MAKKKNPLIEGDVVSGKTGGKSSYTLIMDTMQKGVEANYYWITRFLQAKGPFGKGYIGDAGKIEKIKDVYTAAEASAYWGAIEQRKGIQQDKVSQYMATIGKMVKDTFQIIRELRIIDERKKYYDDSKKGDQSAEIALKSIWVDMVEGGAKNPGSVTGLASQVGFVILPDLFYKITPKSSNEVDKVVDKLKEEGINRKIREVLARKLKQYLIWKEKTENEISTRRNFVLKFLRQHFTVIKMYMSWMRPYLRNIKRLQMRGAVSDIDIVGAFESSKVEIELLGVKYKYSVATPEGYEEEFKFQKHFPCILIKIDFIAMPQMAYVQEQQRGAMHLGRSEIKIEGYVATKEDIEKYKKKMDEDDIELISSVDAAMDSLKEELFKYLKEAGEVIKEEKPPVKKEKKETIFTPFSSLLEGFKDLFGVKKEEKKEVKLTKRQLEQEKGAAKSIAKEDSFRLYDIFKKSHGMLTP